MTKHQRRSVKSWAETLRSLGFRAYAARRLAKYYAEVGT